MVAGGDDQPGAALDVFKNTQILCQIVHCALEPLLPERSMGARSSAFRSSLRTPLLRRLDGEIPIRARRPAEQGCKAVEVGRRRRRAVLLVAAHHQPNVVGQPARRANERVGDSSTVEQRTLLYSGGGGQAG